jgi:plasmid stabilization system protein ParE
MALKIVWTTKAVSGYDEIIEYLNENWGDEEIQNFVRQTQEFLELLSNHPRLLQPTSKKRNVHRGPMNMRTMLTYRVKPRKGLIELVNIQAAKQKPKK